MFNSNVQPKRIVQEGWKDSWYCHKCDQENAQYYTKCPNCGMRRGNDDNYRKGGV